MTAIVLGGAGFIGSALVDYLAGRGMRVVAVDDLSTGRLANVGDALATGQVTFVFGDSNEEFALVEEALREAGEPLDGLFLLHDHRAPLTLSRTLNVPAFSVLPGESPSRFGRSVFGPRMRPDPANLLWQMFVAAAAERPLPIELNTSHVIDVTYVGNVVRDLYAERKRSVSLSSAVVARSDGQLTIGEFGEALHRAARDSRNRVARRHRVVRGGAGAVSEDRSTLDEALRETVRWFSANSSASVAARRA